MSNPTATAKSTANPCACGGITFRSFGKDETRLCPATTKRTFAPGHDAKLKGELIRRELAGDVVVLASGEVVSATYVAHSFGFGHMVAEGVRRGMERLDAKVAKKAAKVKTAERKLAEGAGLVASDDFDAQVAADVAKKLAKAARKAAKKVPAEVAPTVTAKVGRWTYEGVITDSPAVGPQFTYTDGKGVSQTVTKFTRV